MSDPTAPPTEAQIEQLRQGLVLALASLTDRDRYVNALCDMALTALRAQQAQPVAWKIDRHYEGRSVYLCVVFYAADAEPFRKWPEYTITTLYRSPQAQTRREVVEECAAACKTLEAMARRQSDFAQAESYAHAADVVRALAPAIQQGKETK